MRHAAAVSHLLQHIGDDAAAQHYAAVIEHGGLAGGRGAHGGIEAQGKRRPARLHHRAGHCRGAAAHLAREPLARCKRHSAGGKGLLHRDARIRFAACSGKLDIAARQDAAHEDRLAVGDTEAPALAHRVVRGAPVGAKVFPGGADKMPGRICKAACRNERGIAAVRDKAYFLAVRRFGTGKAAMARISSFSNSPSGRHRRERMSCPRAYSI